jgi:hypothetical protein
MLFMSTDYLLVEAENNFEFAEELQKNMKETHVVAHMGRDNGTYWALLERREQND